MGWLQKKFFTLLCECCRSPYFLGAVVLIAAGVRIAQAQTGEVLVLQVEGPVTPTMESYFERGIETAESTDSPLLIVLDTPGGTLDAMQDIVQLFRAADVPVIVYVSPRGAQAASAGSIITFAAHAAAMAPETVIGAASPIDGDGSDLGKTLFNKLTEDLKAQVRALTERRGETAVSLAESMITEARAVHASEALQVGLIDAIAENIPDLLRQLDGLLVVVNNKEVVLKTADLTQRPFEMTFIEKLLHTLANPTIVSLLLAIAIPAILIELSSPGGWVAGFVGVLCLVLGLYGLGQLPVNWLGLGLILVSFVLFGLEVKAAAHGALAITGTITMVAGFLVLFNSPGTPEFAQISVPVAVSISGITAVFFLFIVTMALRARKTPVVTGLASLPGRVGLVRVALTGNNSPYIGMVLVNGELWQAQAEQALPKGEKVVITAVHGLTLYVVRENE